MEEEKMTGQDTNTNVGNIVVEGQPNVAPMPIPVSNGESVGVANAPVNSAMPNVGDVGGPIGHVVGGFPLGRS